MATTDVLKSNIIKAIFPDEYINESNLSNKLIEDYYKTDNVCLNAFQVPDQLSNINSRHGLSKYIRGTNDPIYETVNNIHYTTPYIESPDYDVKDLYTTYHNIFMGKDIDWENAFLKYATTNFDRLDETIEYYDIDPNTGEQVDKGTTDEYKYYTRIPTHINSTYDLYIIIDYLLLKIKSLKFLISYVKSQHKNMKTYKLHTNNS